MIRSKPKASLGRRIVKFFLISPLIVMLFLMAFYYFLLPMLPTQSQIYFLDLLPRKTEISVIFTREVQYWESAIVRWADYESLDPNLVAVVMQIESCGDLTAVSRAGASGLFQVMPFHFVALENKFNPETNALRGLRYLRESLNAANGNPRLALAGYNGGIGMISREESMWPAETHRYVYYGAAIYEDALLGRESSPMLYEWYAKYGEGMCRKASERLGIAE